MWTFQKLKKALQRMRSVFRRRCYYSYRKHFFLEDSFSKTAKLRHINAHQKLNPVVASQDPELRSHFYLKSKLYRSQRSIWVLEGTIILILRKSEKVWEKWRKWSLPTFTSGEQVRLLHILGQTEHDLERQVTAGMETTSIHAEVWTVSSPWKGKTSRKANDKRWDERDTPNFP